MFDETGLDRRTRPSRPVSTTACGRGKKDVPQVEKMEEAETAAAAKASKAAKAAKQEKEEEGEGGKSMAGILMRTGGRLDELREGMLKKMYGWAGGRLLKTTKMKEGTGEGWRERETDGRTDRD